MKDVKYNYSITVIGIEAEKNKERINYLDTYIDVYTASTDVHPDDIAKAMKNIYSDEHPDRDVIKITIERR